jgi:hypothetical protein
LAGNTATKPGLLGFGNRKVNDRGDRTGRNTGGDHSLLVVVELAAVRTGVEDTVDRRRSDEPGRRRRWKGSWPVAG